MPEQMPTTPSEEFSALSRDRQPEREDLHVPRDIGEAAAYAAKPFMDVASGLYAAGERAYMNSVGEFTDDDKQTVMGWPGMRELINSAKGMLVVLS